MDADKFKIFRTSAGIGSILVSMNFTIYVMILFYAYYLYYIHILYGHIFYSSQLILLIWLLFLFGLLDKILTFFGLYGLGGYYGDEGIKRNSRLWFTWAFIGAIYAIVLWLPWIFNISHGVMPSVNPVVYVVEYLAAAAIAVISAAYLKRAYTALAARTGKGLFNTAAKLYWWGSLLTVVYVGLILIWASWILSAAAFFSIRPPQSHGRK